jgi:hypothetical protein
MNERWIYKAYPIMLWALCLPLFFAGIALILAIRLPPLLLFLLPIPTAAFAWLVAGTFVSLYPRIRYVNEVEEDGLGYVHQPLDVLVPFLFIGFAFSILANLIHLFR